MALLGPRAQFQIRQTNKEPEWSSICNNVFDQYLDTNDLFGLEADDHERNSSDESINLFDFSGSSEQSHNTEVTTPLHSWEHPVQVIAEGAGQPQAKEPVTFWAKTLQALEQNAAESERRQSALRSTKSHPDFLSLGGHPSPPAIPSSPIDESSFVQQRLPRATTAGKRRNITARSLSRGRPTGVTKPVVAGSVNPHAIVRQRSVSPSKMMTPSRYRAGFENVWLEQTDTTPRKPKQRRSPSPLFCTPPPSDRVRYEENSTAFGSNSREPAGSAFDEYVSPLTTTFQRTHIHTPNVSSSCGDYKVMASSQRDPVRVIPSNPYLARTTSRNDTAPLYADRPPLTATQIQSFDFGFPPTAGRYVWSTGDSIPQTRAPSYSIDPFTNPDPFAAGNPNVLPTTEPVDLNTVGLGISCDPSLVSIPPMATYLARRTETTPTHLPRYPDGLPRTPHRRAQSCHRSLSPSPPATEPRSSRKAASSRRASRHRRTKSTNSTSNRNSQNIEKDSFVNFTAEDSSKILGGVAPSGSSKTKARREKEAADKRRRLSQAAVRAVVEAGGDLDALNKAGLFV